ncbi:MAG: hypothetical protein Q4E41_09345, partial [Bacteroidales bacterium]|nr:hypothetical protein [Bacteroidales bacterium]
HVTSGHKKRVHQNFDTPSVCEQSANEHPGIGLIGAKPLVDRKHALGTGFQFAARQDKTQVGKSCPQS